MGGERDRKNLLARLAQFAAAKKVRVAVAFDGAPEDNFPDNSTYKTVKIFYNARGSNADERIKAIVENSRERRTLFVVTDDRALSDYVRRCGAKTIRCLDFREQMNRAILNLSQPSEKQESIKPDELGQWMRYFGIDESDDEG
jgi:predicted RNA-binding protein with PIN domain